MNRSELLRNQYSSAMRTAGIGVIELLLPSAGGNGREPAADAVARRAIHADSILRHSAHDSLAAKLRQSRQPQADCAIVATDGAGSYLPEAAVKPGRCATQDLPLSVAWPQNQPTESKYALRFFILQLQGQMGNTNSGKVNPTHYRQM